MFLHFSFKDFIQKMIPCFFCMLLIIFSSFSCFASQYTISDYAPSSTYVSYLEKIDFDNEKYILFRSQNSSQNSSSHILAVGSDLTFDRNTGVISGKATLFIYDSSQNSKFYTIEDDDFSVTYENQIIYSNFIENIPSLDSPNTISFQKILLALLTSSAIFGAIILVFRLVRG